MQSWTCDVCGRTLGPYSDEAILLKIKELHQWNDKSRGITKKALVEPHKVSMDRPNEINDPVGRYAIVKHNGWPVVLTDYDKHLLTTMRVAYDR